jgi:hypothetical protein
MEEYRSEFPILKVGIVDRGGKFTTDIENRRGEYGN